MIIKDGLVFFNNSFSKADISVNNGLIDKISKGLEGQDVFDARGMVVIPGFVNTHTHNAMTLLRGAGDDMPLQEWLSEKIWPLEANLSFDDCYWGNLLGLVEMVKTGTTSFNDMYFFMESLIKALGKIGMRASICHGMIDLFDENKAKKELKESKRLHELCKKEDNLTFCLGPHSPYTCSKELLFSAKEYANENGLRIHIHLAETKKETIDSGNAHGMTPVEYLDSLSLLDERALLAHCVQMTDSDIGILSKRNANVLHCPSSNLKLSSGMARVNDMVEEGVNVSLGTDGASSNNSLDMASEMKTMALMHKLGSPVHLPAKTSFDIATINGAKALGLSSGSIGLGKNADLVFIDADHHSMLPHHNILSNIVYSIKPDAIKHVMINGKMVMRDRKIIGVDEQQIYEKANEHAIKLVEKQ